MLSNLTGVYALIIMTGGLNAPFGARCFLTYAFSFLPVTVTVCLNAPFGARCFLTLQMWIKDAGRTTSLNAPFGARCFLTTTTHGGDGTLAKS